ncbi:hypothetical protein PC123_g26320 [Phytophthora cactorum]|nr:hypothetical protein PC123_g26320 [Phytophthora cactorum]
MAAVLFCPKWNAQTTETEKVALLLAFRRPSVSSFVCTMPRRGTTYCAAIQDQSVGWQHLCQVVPEVCRRTARSTRCSLQIHLGYHLRGDANVCRAVANAWRSNSGRDRANRPSHRISALNVEGIQS